MEVTFGPTEFLKAIADDLERVANSFEAESDYTFLKRDGRNLAELRKIISDIREYTSTKITTIAGTTVISTTTDESK